MSGLRKRLLTGALSRKLSARCNASAGKSSSKPSPIQTVASGSAKKFWDWLNLWLAPKVSSHFTAEIVALRFRRLTTRKRPSYHGKPATRATKPD